MIQVKQRTQIAIKPGYRAFNGYVFKQTDCDRYNAIQKRIAGFKAIGLPVPEVERYDSNQLFKLIIGIL